MAFTPPHVWSRSLVPIAFALLACGCEGSERPPAEGETSFLSHLPRAGGEAISGDASLDSGAPVSRGDEGSAARAIAEADIVRLDGTRLYALSRYSGLSVVDVSDPGALRLLGSYRTGAIPFEMYLEDDRAYVMYNGWGTYSYDESGYSYDVASRVQALDVSDPAAIQLLGDEEIPGTISDSRKVGDVLYLVTHENGYCWGCDTKANTRVASFDMSDPVNFALLDHVRFEVEDAYWLGTRSISVTPERIYVSGRSWSTADAPGIIDVVDISDPSGALEVGAQLSVAGPIDSRWQMDEYQGVLRVISQPGGWNSGVPPRIETFEVTSANAIEQVGALDVVLPRPEVLRSVRFDGPRAYAITFEQTDPLFTFDLTDPAEPVQLGELEIPGWVYHMEPRGDRIYALGFDDTVSGGALHVSLFDVSDMTDPRQLARVNFGGDWANFAEDQDRIHKAFNIVPEADLILVPFSGYSRDGTECSYYYSGYQSGIQLVDMTEDDDLTLRGVAPQVGDARRALLLGEDTVLGVSDDAVQTFDISDRDAPEALDRLDIARDIQDIRALGDAMLRFGTNWWTRETQLDFAALDRVHEATALGSLDLSSVVSDDSELCQGLSYWTGQVFVHGDHAYLPQRSYEWEGDGDGGEYLERIRIYIVDISKRTKPALVGSFALDSNDPEESFTNITKTERALLVGRSKGHYIPDPSGNRAEVRLSYDVIALDDPRAPQVVATVKLPRSIASGGFGYGVPGCAIDAGWGWWGGFFGGSGQAALVSGDVIVSQHEVPVRDGTDRVRYYLDRLDVSDPENPVLLEPVNIPGSLLDFDVASGRIVTVDYLLEEQSARSWEECVGYFDGDTCRVYRRRLNTLQLEGEVARLIDTVILDRGDQLAGNIAATKTRVFISRHDRKSGAAMVQGFAFSARGKIEPLPEVITGSPDAWGALVARDERAFLSASGALTIVDTTDPEAPTTRTLPMGGYSCRALEVTEDTAYCALGAYGVQAFSLE